MSYNLEHPDDQWQDLLARLKLSPLYRDKLAEYDTENVPLKRLSTLPLTTKEDLRRGGAFVHLAVDKREVAQYHESFGTTGEPSASWFTHDDLQRGGRQMRDCGVRLGADDLVLIRFPYAMSLPAFLMQQACWQSGAGIVPASGRTPVTPYPRVLELMRRLGVTVVAGLPREMELLAETARLLGLDPANDFPALRGLCVAGELMGEARRMHIQRLWGVPVFNLYGSTETANLAAMCEHGVMHIAEQDYLVEVLAEDGSGPAAPGERGLAAITTLTHRASPLLRYFNEDVIAVESCDCACGRPGRRLTHYGRLKDRLRFGGVSLDGRDVQDAVYSLTPAPDAWKAIERERGLHVQLDSHRAAEWSPEEAQAVLSERLQVPVTVELVPDGTLLSRKELVQNGASKKPVYLERRHGSTAGTPVPLLHYMLEHGRRSFMRGRFPKARLLFEQAAALAPDSAEAHAWTAATYGRLIGPASMPEKMKLLPLLESEVTAALELDAELPLARRMNGARLLHTPVRFGGDPAGAAAEFRYCIARGMDDAEIWVLLAECQVKQGAAAEAKAALQEALAREPEHVEALKWWQAIKEGRTSL